MRQCLEDIIIGWLRHQSAFASKSRFELELLVADLVREIEHEFTFLVHSEIAHAEGDADCRAEVRQAMKWMAQLSIREFKAELK
jgi:hypothetical protein